MKKAGSKAFTVMELMLAAMITSVVVSVAIVSYAGYRDRAAMLVDETNQKVLLAAVKLYAYDTNALPGSLSQLEDRHLERAYALVTDGKRPYTALAFLQERFGLCEIAEAAPIPSSYLGDNAAQRLKTLTCPVDQTPPPAGHSYGLHAAAANKPLSWLLDPLNAESIIIGESDVANPSDADLIPRHNKGTTVVETRANGTGVRKQQSHGSGSGTGGGTTGGRGHGSDRGGH